MAKNSGFYNTDNKKSYRERRRGGRDRTVAPFDVDTKPKKGLHEGSNEVSDGGLGGDSQAPKVYGGMITPKDYNLKQEKGADLQQEAGADLASKNRLKEKPGTGETVGNLPTYGNGIKNQKKYRKHAAKVKQYAQPYQSSLIDEPVSPKEPEPTPKEENNIDESGSVGYTETEKSEAQADVGTVTDEGKLSEKTSKLEHPDKSTKLERSDKISKLDHSSKSSKLAHSDKTSKLGYKPSVSKLVESTDKPQLQDEPKKRLNTEGSRWSKIKEEAVDTPVTSDADAKTDSPLKVGTPLSGDSHTKDGTPSKPGKLKVGKSKLSADKQGNLEAQAPSKLSVDTPVSPLQHSENLEAPTVGTESATEQTFNQDPNPKGKTQKDVNRKKQLIEAHGQGNQDSKPQRYINTSKSAQSVAYQHRLHDKADKLTKKGSKLREQQAENIEAMPTKNVTTTERVYDETTGRVSKLKKTEKRTLHQNETRWNNPKFTDKLKNAEGAKEKAKVIAKEVGKKGAVLGTAGAAGAIAGVGVAPAVAGAVVAKPVVEYGSKLITNAAHRQVRRDIRQNGDNEVLKAAHWAEQKGERALGQGIRKLNPVAVRRYIKNAPYRRESKLKIKELKNDKKLGLLRVKQDKATGVNHMTGKKSNMITRAWQKRQIKRNYQKAILAAKGKGGGTFTGLARELARGNPKAIIAMAAKKVTVVAVKFIAKVTVFNPLFWKLMALVLMFLIILGSVQACVAIFSPSLAGVGFVNEEDVEFSTRIYSEWETDLAIFVRDSNIEEEFSPPAHITNQPGVNGVVVYPEYPYTPPPPFYEFRFEIGMISHDPMELISYLTAVHGERFDEDSDNPMTRSDLEAILREIFEAQYGIAPGEFDDLITTEEETRFRRERRWEQTGTQPVIIGTNPDGTPIWGTEPIYGYVYHDIYYQFWILTVNLTSRSLSDVLRNRMTEDEEMHFDVLNLTGNGRQVVGNPFDFNWLPNITSHYGYRVHPISNTKEMHLGIDIGLPLGTPIFATHTGEITQVQFSNTGYGNMLRLRGEGSDGVVYYTLFAHLDEIHVTQGQEVEQGDLIATVGSTGDSTGPHLHLEVIRPAQTVTIHGETINLTAMHLNPLFAVITWTDEQSNEAFRPVPGAGGIRNPNLPFIPAIPPEAMSDERFVAILTEASRHLGARYVWGGAGPTTFDCSGFIHWVFTTALSDWTHGRTTAQGYFDMSTPVSAENARPGDLVFFHSTFSSQRFITHIGIYVGNGQMIHTGGNPAGVEFVSLNTPFWQRHFHAFGRI